MIRTRAQAGKVAQKKGMRFEDEIKRTAEIINDKGLGAVWHAHAATKQINGQVLWSARGPFDWFGMLDGGTPVFFETKERDFDSKKPPSRYTLPERDEHQLIALRQAARYSDRALCFVLFNWCWYTDGKLIQAEMRLHPIQTIKDRTVHRDLGLLAPNRNWFYAAISNDYQNAATAAYEDYAADEDIPY